MFNVFVILRSAAPLFRASPSPAAPACSVATSPAQPHAPSGGTETKQNIGNQEADPKPKAKKMEPTTTHEKAEDLRSKALAKVSQAHKLLGQLKGNPYGEKAMEDLATFEKKFQLLGFDSGCFQLARTARDCSNIYAPAAVGRSTTP